MILVLIIQVVLIAPIPIAVGVGATPLDIMEKGPDLPSRTEKQDAADSQITAPDPNGWIPFIPGAVPGTPPELLAKSVDTTGLCVDTNFYGMYNVSSVLNQTLFNFLHIPNMGLAADVGEPAVPMITSFVEVPHDVNLTLEVLYQESQVLNGFYVAPAQEHILDHPNATTPPFTMNQTTYTTNAFFPAAIASIDGANGMAPVIIRGHRIAALNLFPVQFNPVSRQIRVYSKIEIRLNYDRPGQIEFIATRLLACSYERLLQNIIINYPQFYNCCWPIQRCISAEYLIITHDDFYDAILPFAEWKREKGLKTTVVKTSQISATGPTANDITNYIQDAYDNWDPAPNYVLLVGDAEFIPTHYTGTRATDLYYATVDGTDYYPDLYLGRLPVNTWVECENLTYKLIYYEKWPPMDRDFYYNATAASLFQDNNRDGYEDRGYTFTCETITQYLESLGYEVDRIYWADHPAEPDHYNNGVYDHGTALPAHLLWPTFAWDGDDVQIINALTDGRFLIYHRDHGESRNDGWPFDGWWRPTFRHSDAAALNNLNELPVVFSVECQGGWFDGETDGNAGSFESLCEVLVTNAVGGAVAAIGASRNSPSLPNDFLLRGFTDAIWPGFDTTTASGELFGLGQVLTYGKIYTAVMNAPSQTMFELYQLFGDPEMSIWTAEPVSLDVSHPSTIGSGGLQSFVVNVAEQGSGTPVHHAKVCLKLGTALYVEYSDPGGNAHFSITPSTSGSMTITVTKHNYRPYQSTIFVTASGATLTVTPDTGVSATNVRIEGSNFDNGETVRVLFPGAAPTDVPAVAGSFSIDPFSVPSGPDGFLNVIAYGLSSGRYAVTKFRRLAPSPPPDPFIYSQWDPATWYLNPTGGDPRWNNPDIEQFERATGTFVASNNLVVGTTYTIRATIHNDESVAATNTQVTFQWALWGAGQVTWNPIGSPVVVTIPARVSPAPHSSVTADVDWTPSITGHTCLKVSLYHPNDMDLNNNEGQENTHVQPVTSPATFTFTVSNPTNTRGLVYLETRQIDGLSLWETRIQRPYPQTLDPGANQTVTVTVNAPTDAAENETRGYIINAYINGQLIGGITFTLVVQREQPPLLPWWFIPLVASVVVVCIVITAVIVRRRK